MMMIMMTVMMINDDNGVGDSGEDDHDDVRDNYDVGGSDEDDDGVGGSGEDDNVGDNDGDNCDAAENS